MHPDIIRQQISALLRNCPELEADDVLRADMIEGETDLPEFLRAVERKRQDAFHMASAIGENIAALKERQDRLDRREQALRGLHMKMMDEASLHKCELPEATLIIAKGRPKVIITDEAALPANCVRLITKPDKDAIKDLLGAGQPVPGAALSNAEPYLTIRTK